MVQYRQMWRTSTDQRLLQCRICGKTIQVITVIFLCEVMKESEETPWTCTDPDNFQYGRRLSTYKFEFKEFDRHSNRKEYLELLEKAIDISSFGIEYFIEIEIDLEDYSMRDIMEHTESYYGNLDEIVAQYGKDFTWIVAECVFEQESGLY